MILREHVDFKGVRKQCVQPAGSQGNTNLFSLEKILLIFQNDKMKVTDFYYQYRDPQSLKIL